MKSLDSRLRGNDASLVSGFLLNLPKFAVALAILLIAWWLARLLRW